MPLCQRLCVRGLRTRRRPGCIARAASEVEDADGNACAATQGGDLRHIMRHYAYAPQRFESWANPMRKYACTLNAVALLLADVAGDERQTKQRREMAQQCLDAMTPRDLWETGIVGDFGEIAMRCDARS